LKLRIPHKPVICASCGSEYVDVPIAILEAHCGAEDHFLCKKCLAASLAHIKSIQKMKLVALQAFLGEFDE
jgi:hypothetical protein